MTDQKKREFISDAIKLGAAAFLATLIPTPMFAEDKAVMEKQSMKGKTFFITGGSRGIGRATAEIICMHGGNVVIADKYPEYYPLYDDYGVTKDELEKHGGQALILSMDQSKPDEIHAAVNQAAKHFGGVDAVCDFVRANNDSLYLSMLEADKDDIDYVHAVHVHGSKVLYLTSRSYLKKSDLGFITFMGVSPKFALSQNKNTLYHYTKLQKSQIYQSAAKHTSDISVVEMQSEGDSHIKYPLVFKTNGGIHYLKTTKTTLQQATIPGVIGLATMRHLQDGFQPGYSVYDPVVYLANKLNKTDMTAFVVNINS